MQANMMLPTAHVVVDNCMFVIVSLVLLFISHFSVAWQPAVVTQQGEILGKVISLSQKRQVFEFSGIPYAEAPVGPLRFRKPVAKERWDTPLDATVAPKLCGPLALTDLSKASISEDCLFLNVWVPASAFIDNQPPGQKLAVMAFIHGVEFLGDVNSLRKLYNGSVLAGHNNVIVATIQYRLGSLGFAYFDQSDSPGNVGLWDQQEALKWLHANIEAFGGNASQITMFGQSGGAIFTSYHLLSAKSRPYFARAIFESGSSLADWSIQRAEEAAKASEALFLQIGAKFCNLTEDTNVSLAEKMQCLRSVGDASDFLEADKQVATQLGLGLPFSAIVDGDFFVEDPVAMMKAGDFYRVPVMLGANKDEGSQLLTGSPEALMMLPNFTNPDKPLDALNAASFETLATKSSFSLFPNSPQMKSSLLLDTILMLYYPTPKGYSEEPSGSEIVKAALDVVGDYAFMCPTLIWPTLATASAGGDKVPYYVYYFSHRRRGTGAPKWMGTMHGAEMPFVFGEPLAPHAKRLGYTLDDKALSKIIMAYWANFAKYGNPNSPKPTKVYTEQGWGLKLRPWPEFNSPDCPTKIIELNVLTSVFVYGKGTHCGFKTRECAFWTALFPKLAKTLANSTIPVK